MKRFKGDLRSKCFTQSVISICDELPEEVVKAGKITTFKKYLDRYLNECL